MVLALAATQRGDQAGDHMALRDRLFGLIFLGGQDYEFTSFLHEGMGLHDQPFSQTFYMLVGTHGTHVAIGVVWLIGDVGRVDDGQARQVERALGRDRGTLLAFR